MATSLMKDARSTVWIHVRVPKSTNFADKISPKVKDSTTSAWSAPDSTITWAQAIINSIDLRSCLIERSGLGWLSEHATQIPLSSRREVEVASASLEDHALSITNLHKLDNLVIVIFCSSCL